MTLKHLFLSSALSGSLAFYPLAIKAQDYDAWVLNREVLNSAANYTGALTSSHSEVRKYITWRWNTSLDKDEQRTRTADILRQIRADRRVGDGDDGEPLVPSLDMDVLDSYGVRFRYCDSTLLSYFETVGFKHNLSAQQIIDAPVLRATRNGTTFYGEPLGRVVPDDGEGLMLHTEGGRRPARIPPCMAAEYGGALAEGTVAYMTSAAQKFGVARTRKRRETEKLRCPAPQVGPGIRRERFRSTDYNAQGDPLYNDQSEIAYDAEDEDLEYPYYDTATQEGDDTADPEGDGHWKETSSHCRAPATIPIYQVEDCPVPEGTDEPHGTATYRVFLTEVYGPPLEGSPKKVPPIVWLPSDADGNFVDEAVKELVPHLSFCDGTAPDSLTLEPEISHRQEDRPGICPATHPLGSLTETRDIEIRSWSFADSDLAQDFDALREVTTEIEGAWGVSDDRCYRDVNDTSTESKTSACPSGQRGSVTYQRTKTKTGIDWHWAGWQDALTASHTRWETASNNCKRTSGGGGDDRGRESSIDVDGDGYGDYSSDYAAEQDGHYDGREVSDHCGGCGGPDDSNEGSDRNSSGSSSSGAGGL